jgi:hypothetical protein
MSELSDELAATDGDFSAQIKDADIASKSRAKNG